MQRRIVIPGGSGQVGQVLARYFHSRGDHVTVLARKPEVSPWPTVLWDGKNLDTWTQTLEGSHLLINLAGRSVNCRYNAANRAEIMQSRVQTTSLLGQAIGKLKDPPHVWMNASTATIYRHALDRPMDEISGELGGGEAGAPETWRFSIEVAKSWEKAFTDAATPQTRKIALRSAMTMSPDPGGVFDVLLRLVRFGLGGTSGLGNQYVSWIHQLDFVHAVEFLYAHEEIDGEVNLSAPNPLSNREFMRAIRQAWGSPIGLPATAWMLEIGAIAIRTETELILKSRRVVPKRLLDAGFEFKFARWPDAAQDLVQSWRGTR